MIMSLIEVVKHVFPNAKKFVPLVAVALGLAFSILYLFPGNLQLGIFFGIQAGLMATGFWSGGKNIYEGISGKKL